MILRETSLPVIIIFIPTTPGKIGIFKVKDNIVLSFL